MLSTLWQSLDEINSIECYLKSGITSENMDLVSYVLSFVYVCRMTIKKFDILFQM